MAEYTINKEYFSLGSAFYIEVGTNDYRNGILTGVSDKWVEFTIYNRANDVEKLKLDINMLMSCKRSMYKLKVDYTDGAFKNDEYHYNYI
jgi:hypothetical protein